MHIEIWLTLDLLSSEFKLPRKKNKNQITNVWSLIDSIAGSQGSDVGDMIINIARGICPSAVSGNSSSVPFVLWLIVQKRLWGPEGVCVHPTPLLSNGELWLKTLNTWHWQDALYGFRKWKHAKRWSAVSKQSGHYDLTLQLQIQRRHFVFGPARFNWKDWNFETSLPLKAIVSDLSEFTE